MSNRGNGRAYADGTTSACPTYSTAADDSILPGDWTRSARTGGSQRALYTRQRPTTTFYRGTGRALRGRADPNVLPHECNAALKGLE